MVPEILGLLAHPGPQVQARLGDALARLAAGRLAEQIRAGLIRALKGTARPAAEAAPA